MRKDSAPRHASWQDLLASPCTASHIVQIYDSDEFLASGVALFAAEGLRRGEAVLLTGTEAHLNAVRERLRAQGIDHDTAKRSGQLSVHDVRQAAAALLRGGALDPARFETLAAAALATAKADARFSGVRWWGEITNFLNQHGNAAAGLAAEALADAAAKRHGVTIFCSFLCDRFDPQGYDGMLRDLCCRHSHVIPTEDYVRHRLAVNRAIGEVIGEIKGPLLQSLLSWKGFACDLPSSQALLFWVREALPEQFQPVLERVKAYA